MRLARDITTMMRHAGQQRSEIMTWSVPTLQTHLVILHTERAHEAQEKGAMYQALGPIASMFGGNS